MKIIIDIPEKVYTYIQREWKEYDFDSVVNHALNGIKNGTPLPNVHGRLLVVSEDRLRENQINLDWSCQKWISEVGLSNATVKIIKADKEEKDADN